MKKEIKKVVKQIKKPEIKKEIAKAEPEKKERDVMKYYSEHLDEFRKKLDFNIDLKNSVFKIDCIQEKLLQFYLRNDRKFRQAFYQNYTSEFVTFLKDKSKLKEPIHLSCMGTIRGGKSYAMITLCIIQNLLNNRLFSVDYICGNIQEFVEKLRTMGKENLDNSCFLIDEEKTAIFGQGSFSKKTKTEDIQNIIAISNISSIQINPQSWANAKAMYGLRAWGRCFENKTTRFMLYNLQAGGRGGETPMGCVYLPTFVKFTPKDYGEDLEKKYMKKKMSWVEREKSSSGGDVLGEIKKNSAMSFLKDKQFMSLTKKAEQKTFISIKLGSEWTKGECEEIFLLTEMFKRGIRFEK
jgi:hypothetical protein